MRHNKTPRDVDGDQQKSKRTPAGPKGDPESRRMWPNLERGVQNRRYAKIAIKRQKGTQKGPKGPQKGPKGAQEGPKGAQEGPKRAQKGPKTSPKGTLESPNRVPNEWKPYFLDFDAGLEPNR